MKILLKLLPFVCLFFFACEKKNKSTSTENTASEAVTQEIINLEEETKTLEANKQAIDEKSKELENLLDEIDQ